MSDRTYSLAISYSTGGQFAMNVMHYRFDDGLYSNTVAAATALINAWDTHCTAKLKDCLSVHTQILSYKARAVQGVGGFEAIKLGVAGDIGARAGDLSVSGLAPWFRFLTAAVPPITGRLFLPGVSDDDVINGDIQGGLATEMDDLAAALHDSITLAGGGAPVANPVVFSRSPVGASFAIVQVEAMRSLSTQRKRQSPA